MSEGPESLSRPQGVVEAREDSHLESGEHEPETKPGTTKFINESDNVEDKKDDGSADSGHEGNKKGGRRKITIEFIENKSRRHVTFSKRKAGLIKKAYELSTLTGTQVLLLVASETGNVYTFATPKLQPLITKPEGKTLIQSCLNPPEPQQHSQPPPAQNRLISQEPGTYMPEKKERKLEPKGPSSIGDLSSFPTGGSYPHPGGNAPMMPNPVMYPYMHASYGHPNSRPVPYPAQYPPGHAYQGGSQYPTQIQGQPPGQYQSYMGYNNQQSGSSFPSHEGGSSPRHAE